MRLFSFSTSCIVLAITATISVSAQAAQPDISGRVAVDGEIVESACALNPDHLEKYIMLNNISPDRLMRGNGSELYPFSIDLINCNPGREGGLGFQITFEGPADGQHFALQGEGRGLALEIQDDRGFIAHPGVAMPPQSLAVGGTKLNYNLRLVGNQKLMKAGSQFTLLKYKLDYY